ncbi:hypothetical protein C900_03475 [Fulvivirga imtechensis AK7]|uniref:Uncharacterized protein n=1 Tax=Fulvivirga imtechensis AK7 TaxID=1237149 RepID=L8JTS2_9BACT|nr:hypothetical protein C900_03475 [Fulvivirga imtechensis AK7]
MLNNLFIVALNLIKRNVPKDKVAQSYDFFVIFSIPHTFAKNLRSYCPFY